MEQILFAHAQKKHLRRCSKRKSPGCVIPCPGCWPERPLPFQQFLYIIQQHLSWKLNSSKFGHFFKLLFFCCSACNKLNEPSFYLLVPHGFPKGNKKRGRDILLSHKTRWVGFCAASFLSEAGGVGVKQ